MPVRRDFRKPRPQTIRLGAEIDNSAGSVDSLWRYGWRGLGTLSGRDERGESRDDDGSTRRERVQPPSH
jgi:hypothetical protein